MEPYQIINFICLGGIAICVLAMLWMLVMSFYTGSMTMDEYIAYHKKKMRKDDWNDMLWLMYYEGKISRDCVKRMMKQ